LEQFLQFHARAAFPAVDWEIRYLWTISDCYWLFQHCFRHVFYTRLNNLQRRFWKCNEAERRCEELEWFSGWMQSNNWRLESFLGKVAKRVGLIGESQVGNADRFPKLLQSARFLRIIFRPDPMNLWSKMLTHGSH
jgi:hypothetical protein